MKRIGDWQSQPAEERIQAGPWDQCDPLCNALLVLVAKTNALQDAYDSFATGEERPGRPDGATQKDIAAARKARSNAVLMVVEGERKYQHSMATLGAAGPSALTVNSLIMKAIKEKKS